MTQKTWEARQAEAIGRAIKELRGKRSAQWLSDQTTALGYAVSRSTITDIENRRRKYISTAELSVIAWALGVPPVQLLFPALPDGDAEIVPGVHTTAIRAATWFSGETLMRPVLESTDEPDEQWKADAARIMELEERAELILLSRRRIELNQRLHTVASTIAQLSDSAPDAIPSMLESLTRAKVELGQVEGELLQIPGAVVVATDATTMNPNQSR